jgi:2,3-bisphosphoglycerate-dependent phosphoglycerate mutase
MPRLERRSFARLGAALFLLLLVGVVVGVGWLRCGVPTTLFIVRHADRAGADDALAPAGVARALVLAHVLAREQLAAIYHSDTRRTRDTAAPLAQALGLATIERPALAVQELVKEIFAEHRGKRTLVVAHSNTAVQIVAAAGGPSLPNIADDEFDNLFVLDVCGCFGSLGKRVNLLELQYGAASP